MFATFMAIAAFAAAAPAPLHFDCMGPVTQASSATAILAAFGKDARRADVPGMAGKPAKGVVLYSDDPARRLEIAFWDDAQTTVESVTIEAKAMAWTGPLGLHAGSTLAEVIAANGQNFSLTGFNWDYGGYVSKVWGGKLLKPHGGCVVQIRLAPATGVKLPEDITGEHDLDSAMPLVKAADPRIDRLSVGWPLPAGVKMSADGAGRLGF